MSSEIDQPQVPKVVRDTIAKAIEIEGYDAIVFIATKVKRNRTRVHMVCRGNQLACNGLIEHAYTEVFGVEDPRDEEDDDD